MVIEFTSRFEKELQKVFSKSEAKKIVQKLLKTKPTDGKFISIVANILIRERKEGSFRFYFIQRNTDVRFLTSEELSLHILRFIELSKKNNQQNVIDRLKKDLEKAGVDF